MENLSKNAVITLIATTVIGMVVTGVVTWLVATSSAGMDAAEKARIEGVVAEMLKMDDERTYGQVISSLDRNVSVLTTEVENMDENLDLIREAVQAIASDP